jgi:lipid A 4'-phosphatase
MKISKKWLLPLLVLVAIAPITPWIDLKTAHFFYQIHPWGEGHFIENSLTAFFYKYGELFGFFVGSLACLTLLFTWMFPTLKTYRRAALSLVLILILGAGVMTNVLLKEYWGRPRPKQLEEFGGKMTFRPFYLPHWNPQEPQKSFPSGHATMGFYYFSVCFIGQRLQNKALFRIGIFMTSFLGIALSLTRIAQGGHFVSDTLVAAAVMWWTSLFVDWLIFETTFLERSKKLYSKLHWRNWGRSQGNI